MEQEPSDELRSLQPAHLGDLQTYMGPRDSGEIEVVCVNFDFLIIFE